MRNQHVLLVDDNCADRALFLSTTKKAFSELIVSVANNGREGLEYLRLPNQPVPNLIIFDLHMPVLGGLECLRELKNDPKLKSIPVIVFSSSVDRYEIAQVKLLGGERFVAKPSDLEGYFSAVQSLLQILVENHKGI